SAADTDAPRKAAPAKGRAAPKASPRPPTTVAADRPRLSVSSGASTALTGAATEADRERARQERANAIEAETQVLRQRIVQLTAMVEKMQQELRTQEAADQAAVRAAKAPDTAAKAPEAAAIAPGSNAPSAAADAAKAPALDSAPAAETDKAPAAEAPKSTPPAAKAEPPGPVPSWWEQNSLLFATIVGLPLVIAAFLL